MREMRNAKPEIQLPEIGTPVKWAGPERTPGRVSSVREGLITVTFLNVDCTTGIDYCFGEEFASSWERI